MLIEKQMAMWFEKFMRYLLKFHENHRTFLGSKMDCSEIIIFFVTN